MSATRFEADRKIQGVNPNKRKCYFPDDHPQNHPMKIHQNYTQANCLFECKLEFVQRQIAIEGGKKCVPWFYPSQDEFSLEICDPWQTKKFQTLLQNVEDGKCKHCLPDCVSTKYKTILTSAPFGDCDRTNLGLSRLCDLSFEKRLMVNPPTWKHIVEKEYVTFDGGQIPSFIKNPKNLLDNIRQFATEEESINLAFRAQHENNPSYNAVEEDVTLVNFYFDESEVIQYLSYLRMTPTDFISKVSNVKNRLEHDTNNNQKTF